MIAPHVDVKYGENMTRIQGWCYSVLVSLLATAATVAIGQQPDKPQGVAEEGSQSSGVVESHEEGVTQEKDSLAEQEGSDDLKKQPKNKLATAVERLTLKVDALALGLDAVRDRLVAAVAEIEALRETHEQTTQAHAQRLEALSRTPERLDALDASQERSRRTHAEAQKHLHNRLVGVEERSAKLADRTDATEGKLVDLKTDQEAIRVEIQERQMNLGNQIEQVGNHVESVNADLHAFADSQNAKLKTVTEMQYELRTTYLKWIAVVAVAISTVALLCCTFVCVFVLHQRSVAKVLPPTRPAEREAVPHAVPAVALPSADSDCIVDADLWQNMMSHLQEFPRTEQGGFAIGFRRDGQSYLVATVFPEQVGASGAHCEFRTEDIEIIRSVMDEVGALENCVVAAWVHTHPGLGIFLSPTDKSTIRSWSALDPNSRFLVIDTSLSGFERQVGAFDASFAGVTITRANCTFPEKAQEAFQDAVRRAYTARGLSSPTVICGACGDGLGTAVLEAVIAAIFLDPGSSSARDFILRLLDTELKKVIIQGTKASSKSELQELTQAAEQQIPTYHLIEAMGPDHDRTFTVEIRLGKVALARGSGKSKKAAETEAARSSLEKLSTNFTQ